MTNSHDAIFKGQDLRTGNLLLGFVSEQTSERGLKVAAFSTRLQPVSIIVPFGRVTEWKRGVADANIRQRNARAMMGDETGEVGMAIEVTGFWRRDAKGGLEIVVASWGYVDHDEHFAIGGRLPSADPVKTNTSAPEPLAA